MKRKRFSTEQIVAVLKQAELGLPVADLIRQVGITEQTFYRWKRQYGGLESDQVRELKQVTEENVRLKRLVALIMGKDLPAHEVDRAAVAAAVAEAMAAIEIVDSRIADWKITFADTVADNGSSGLFVLGKERKPIAGLDLWTNLIADIIAAGIAGHCLLWSTSKA